MQLSVSVSKRGVLFRLSAIKCNFFFNQLFFSQLIKGVNTHLIALVFLLKLINDTLFVLYISLHDQENWRRIRWDKHKQRQMGQPRLSQVCEVIV